MNFYDGFESKNLFNNGWSIIKGQYFNNQAPADHICSTSSNNFTNTFSPDYKVYPNGFQVISKQFAQPYSTVQVDILYFVKQNDFVDFKILDSTTFLSSKMLQSQGDRNNQECNFKLTCNSSSMSDVVRESLSYSNQMKDKSPTISFTYKRKSQHNDQFGLLKIMIWSNCIENCYSCSDSQNCSICIKGFYIYILSNGQRVCDENIGCKTLNCYSCIKNESLKLNQCVKCNPGYTLTSSNTCQKVSPEICGKGQYYQSSSNQCVSYSKNCSMQVSGNYNKWQDCLQEVDTTKIKCPNEKNVLIFEIKNYQIYSCGCQVDFCDICEGSVKLTCQKCKIGYFLNDEKNLCTFDKCPHEYILDPISQECVVQYHLREQKRISQMRNIQGQNNSCLVKDCTLCNLNDELICDTCNQGFTYNQVTQTCEQKCTLGYEWNNDNKKCKGTAKHCLQFNVVDGSKCDICNENYQFYNPTRNCICKLENCANCDTDPKICQQCKQGYVQRKTKLDCECEVQYCDVCQPTGICVQCLPGFDLDKTTNKKCKPICVMENCEECEFPPNHNTKCKKCKIGYEIIIYEQPEKAVCEKMKCKIPQCKSCLLTDYSICEECQPGFDLINGKKQCRYNLQNEFESKAKKIGYGYDVTIVFTNDTPNNNLQIDYSKIFSFKITGIDSYTYIMTDTKQKQISFKFTVNENCKGKQLQVNMDNTQFHDVYNFQNSYDEIKLENYAYETDEQKEQAAAAQQASKSIQTTLLSSMFPIAMIGNFYVLFNTIDLTTFIYFLLFLDIRYPTNVISFCSVFQNFQMAFIPNIFQVYLIEGSYLQPYTPTKFLEYGNDAYFLNSAGQSYTIVFGILSIYFILKILSFIKITGLQAYIQKKIESGWEYNAFFDLIWTVYMYVVVGVFLQFYSFEFIESLCFFNYTLFAMSFIAIFVIPICITIFIAKTPDLNDENIQKQFSSIVGGLKLPKPNMTPVQMKQIDYEKTEEDILSPTKKSVVSDHRLQEISPKDKNGSKNLNTSQEDHEQIQQKDQVLTKRQQRTLNYSKYANVFLYFRKIAYAIVIIYMYEHPYGQLFFISLLNLFLAVFYFYIRPHEKDFENIRNGLSEAILIVMQIAVSSLVEDKQEQQEQDRIIVGWVLISCAGSILFMHIITVVLDLLKSLFNLIKDFFITVYQSYKQRQNKQLQQKLDKENKQKNINNLMKLPIGELASQISMPFYRTQTRHLSSKILAASPSKFSPRKSFRKSITKVMAGINLKEGCKQDDSQNFGYISDNLRDSQNNIPQTPCSQEVSEKLNQTKSYYQKQFMNEKKNFDDISNGDVNRLKSAGNSIILQNMSSIDNNPVYMSMGTMNQINQLLSQEQIQNEN